MTHLAIHQNLTSWSGESLFWGLILFLASLFILFFPIEFLNNFYLENRTFTELISNILFTILTSLFFLVSVSSIHSKYTRIL